MQNKHYKKIYKAYKHLWLNSKQSGKENKKYKVKYRLYKALYNHQNDRNTSIQEGTETTARSSSSIQHNPITNTNLNQTQKQENAVSQTINDQNTVNVFLPAHQETYYGWVEGELQPDEQLIPLRDSEQGEVVVYLGYCQQGEPVGEFPVDENGRFRFRLLPNYYSLSIKHQGKEQRVDKLPILPLSTNRLHFGGSSMADSYPNRLSMFTDKE